MNPGARKLSIEIDYLFVRRHVRAFAQFGNFSFAHDQLEAIANPVRKNQPAISEDHFTIVAAVSDRRSNFCRASFRKKCDGHRPPLQIPN